METLDSQTLEQVGQQDSEETSPEVVATEEHAVEVTETPEEGVMELDAIDKILAETSTITITQEKMLEYWKGTVEYVESLTGEEKVNRIKLLSSPFTRIRRPACRLAKNIFSSRGKLVKCIFVDTFERVEELLKRIPQFTVETNYNGKDNDRVTLIKGMLPYFYDAKVMHIKMKDLPHNLEYDPRDEHWINVVRETDSHGELVLRYYCKFVDGFFPTLPLRYRNHRNQVVQANGQALKAYHCICFKVCRYDDGAHGIVQSWDVGLDPEYQAIYSDEDRFVMLGEPW